VDTYSAAAVFQVVSDIFVELMLNLQLKEQHAASRIFEIGAMQVWEAGTLTVVNC